MKRRYASNKRDERLRACWLVPAFPESADDPNYTFLWREARELTELALVDLLVVVVDGEWNGEQPDGFEVRPLPRPRSAVAKARSLWSSFRSDPNRTLSFIKNPEATYPTLWRIGSSIQMLREWRPDVVHSHFAVPNGTCGLPVAKALGAASVVSLRGVDLAVDEDLEYGFRRDQAYDRELRSSVAQVELCLTATGAMRAMAIDAGARESTAAVLPNSFNPAAVDTEIAVTRPDGAVKVILSVGHLIERKGFDRGVRALAQLPSDHHYVVIGSGPELDRLVDLAAKLGVNDRTHFIGQVPPGEVVPWMRAADCYWFLSRFEAFGNVLLEAFASGSPIVATSRGVAPELAGYGGSCSILIDPDDTEELARLTKLRIMHGPLEPKSEVLERFSSATRSFELANLYRRVCQASAAQTADRFSVDS